MENHLDTGINNALLSRIQHQYILDWNGVHGIRHWERVERIGMRLAQETGADMKLVRLFAYFHDSCRHSDDYDPYHGPRAAAFIESINDELLHLSPGDLELLRTACIGHSNGKTFHPDITVMTCWDADRLDLGRVGTMPNPNKLCTLPGKDKKMIQWAYDNSRK